MSVHRKYTKVRQFGGSEPRNRTQSIGAKHKSQRCKRDQPNDRSPLCMAGWSVRRTATQSGQTVEATRSAAMRLRVAAAHSLGRCGASPQKGGSARAAPTFSPAMHPDRGRICDLPKQPTVKPPEDHRATRPPHLFAPIHQVWSQDSNEREACPDVPRQGSPDGAGSRRARETPAPPLHNWLPI